MILSQQKIEEITQFLISIARRGKIAPNDIEDVVNETWSRLLIEVPEIDDDNRLFYRAKILFSEARADYFAESLALSGVKRSAHYAAMKYLRENDGDPAKAYQNQSTTAKVSMRLLQAMSYEKHGMMDAFPQAQEQHSHVLSNKMAQALLSLTEYERSALMMFAGYESNAMTIADIARELGLGRKAAITLVKDAQSKMQDALHRV